MKTKITILALLLCFPLFLAAQNDNINENDSLTPQKGYKSFFGGNSTTYSVARPIIVNKSRPITCKYNDSDALLGDCVTYNYSFTSDTITINGLTYYKGSVLNEYLREDTLTGRLYRYITQNHSEVLVCDMSLSKGDTFYFSRSPEFYLPMFYHIVDTVFYDSTGSKRIYFDMGGTTTIPSDGSIDPAEFNIHMAFIEGVGPIYGPIGDIGVWGMDILLCVEKDDTLAYMTNEELGCYQTYNWWWDINVEENAALQMHVYPNPASQRVSVEVANMGGGGTLRLVNAIGMVLQTKEITDNVTEFDIPDYANGLYTIIYTDDKNNRAAVKFVKQ